MCRRLILTLTWNPTVKDGQLNFLSMPVTTCSKDGDGGQWRNLGRCGTQSNTLEASAQQTFLSTLQSIIFNIRLRALVPRLVGNHLGSGVPSDLIYLGIGRYTVVVTKKSALSHLSIFVYIMHGKFMCFIRSLPWPILFFHSAKRAAILEVLLSYDAFNECSKTLS